MNTELGTAYARMNESWDEYESLVDRIERESSQRKYSSFNEHPLFPVMNTLLGTALDCQRIYHQLYEKVNR